MDKNLDREESRPLDEDGRAFRRGLNRSFRQFLYNATLAAGFVFGLAPALADPGLRLIQFVSPGESIQAAVDRAAPGGLIFVQPGVYVEASDPMNGLNLTRSVHLIGLSTPSRKVVLRSSGTQRNGIVAVPAAHTNCLSCHSSLAPPFSLLPGVSTNVPQTPTIQGLSIRGITIENFTNNGLFTRNVSNFQIVDVHSVGNKNYGIFPTLSENGLITGSSASGSDDSGIWVETSRNVIVADNLAEGNMVGIEVSNSENVVLVNNEVRGNSAGIAVLFLPWIFNQRSDVRRITAHNNRVQGNNRRNMARPGTLLAGLPSGVGIFHLGADDSVFTQNTIENHDLGGIAIVDFCLAFAGGPLDCRTNTTFPPGFLADATASTNRVLHNQFRNNGLRPDPASPFAFAASDIALLTSANGGNCFTGNTYSRFFSTLGFLPACP
jgi:parallel beta-helix repeat protein